MATLNKTRTISLIAQQFALKRAFPESNATVRRNRLYWSGVLQPTGLSDTYSVKLTYSLEMSPKTFVTSPEICDREFQIVPHRYSDGSLCLFLPKNGEWNQGMYVAETIIPWACEWLFHYELWLVTGEWHGGGIHPGDKRMPNA